MNLFDRISSTFCFFLGLAVLAGGVRLGLRVQLDMGPGFFPMMAGGILSFLSVFLFVQSWTNEEGKIRKKSFWANRDGWKMVLLALLPTMAYPFALNFLGFLPATLLYLFFLFLVIGYQKWWMAALSGIAASLAIYMIFDFWLKANFPRGILPF